MKTDDFSRGLYIRRPALQDRRKRVAYHFVTVVAWALYLYLWLPLVTAALWWLATRLGVRELAFSAQHVDLDLFRVVGATFLVAVTVLIGWAEYNRNRFQGVERRKRPPALDPMESAAALGASPVLAARLQGSRHCELLLDTDAAPVGIREAVASTNRRLREENPA